MGSWRKMYSFRDEDSNSESERFDDELERAYKRGCEHGYKKAMEELYGERDSGYGERNGFGGRSWTIREGEGRYGERGRDSMGRFR